MRTAARRRRALAFATLLLGAAAIARSQCPVCVGHQSFGPAPEALSTRFPGEQYSYSANARAVAAGDFNNDGIPDLAVGADTLLIYLGTGGGRFAAPVPYLASSGPVVTGDFDKDGNLDLAVVGSGILTVFLGDGTGSFPRVLSGPFVGGIDKGAAGDFDGDGNLDLALADNFVGKVSIMHGAGDGTFSLLQTLLVGHAGESFNPSFLRAGDLNGDGIDDLAVSSPRDGNLGIIWGRLGGGLSVSPLTDFNRGGNLWIGDFDGDHIPDLAVQASDDFSGIYSILILKGDGNGGFRTIGSFVAGYSIRSITGGDFNGDGHLDLALYKDYDVDTGTYGLLVFPGLGNGMFDAPVQTLTTGYAPGALVAADVDLDGSLDLLVPNQTDETITVLLGAGNGHFQESTRFAASVGVQGIVTADFNGDGNPDVAVGAVSVLLGDGNGSLQSPRVSFLNADGAIVTGDFNGDGKPDITGASSSETLQILLGVGDGTFQPPIPSPKSLGSVRLAVGDFNHDGNLDLLVHYVSLGELDYYAGRGDGTFTAPVVIATINALSLAVADVNGDGALDILLTFRDVSLPPTLRVLLGNGDGTFQAPILSPLDDEANGVGVGDFDEDGMLDAVVSYPARGQLSILFGDGTGSFGSPALFEAKKYPNVLTVSDFTGDGHLDVVLTGQDQYVTILAGTGDGRLGRAEIFALPGTAVGTVIADFDKDGKPDLAVASVGDVYVPGDDFVVLLRNTSCEPRRLDLVTNPSTCAAPGSPFSVQPVLRLLDDGGNLVACAGGNVSAAIVPGSGTAGATLGGVTTVPVSNGEAAFSDLSIDTAGAGYVLQFEHPQAGRTRSRAITAGAAPPVSIDGPAQICESGMFHASAGFDTYVWSVDGVFAGTHSSITVIGPAIGLGDHTLSVLATKAGCSAAASFPIRVDPLPLTAITAPDAVCPYTAGHVASAPDAGPGSSYAWSIVNGVINTGNGTREITFKAGPSGSVTLSVVVTNAQACSAGGTTSVAINPTLSCPPPVGYFTVPPCRVADTRGAPGPSGGPVLTGGTVRTFPVTGLCGIPPSAKVVVINLAVVRPSESGDLRVYPGGTAAPLASTISFRAGYRTGQQRGDAAWSLRRSRRPV